MADKRAYDLTNQATLDTDAYFVIDKDGWATARRLQGSILDARYLLESNNLSDLDNAATARTNLGVAIGTNVQAWDTQLDDIAALDPTQNDNFIVADGANWTQETPAQVRTTLGLVAGGAGDIWVEKAGDTMAGGLTISAGGLTVDGATVFNEAGADVSFRVESADQANMLKVDGTLNRVGIRTNVALAAVLHVDHSSTTGAIPVLLLDQADIDQEFIRFVGSSEDSQADRSLVDAADMTTPGALTGWIQVYVEDVQSTNPIPDGVYYIPFYAAPSA